MLQNYYEHFLFLSGTNIWTSANYVHTVSTHTVLYICPIFLNKRIQGLNPQSPFKNHGVRNWRNTVKVYSLHNSRLTIICNHHQIYLIRLDRGCIKRKRIIDFVSLFFNWYSLSCLGQEDPCLVVSIFISFPRIVYVFKKKKSIITV